MWNEMLLPAGFLVLTYVPLQCVVLWKCRGAARVAAVLPLLFMVPMLFDSLQPLDFDLGSAWAMYFVCPYLPTMIYLVVFSLVGPRRSKACPHCGHRPRVKSFQIASCKTNCEQCGKKFPS